MEMTAAMCSLKELFVMQSVRKKKGRKIRRRVRKRVRKREKRKKERKKEGKKERKKEENCAKATLPTHITTSFIGFLRNKQPLLSLP